MTRATNREQQIPKATESPKYLDARQIARELGAHLAEVFVGKVTGADGEGATLEGVPFEPAVVEAINEGGSTPAWYKSVFATSGAVHLEVLAAADENSNPPTLTENSPTDWDIAFPTEMAPNDETLTVVVYGFRDVNGSE